MVWSKQAPKVNCSSDVGHATPAMARLKGPKSASVLRDIGHTTSASRWVKPNRWCPKKFSCSGDDGHQTPAMVWLKLPYNFTIFKDAGQMTPSMGQLNPSRNVSCCNESCHTVPFSAPLAAYDRLSARRGSDWPGTGGRHSRHGVTISGSIRTRNVATFRKKPRRCRMMRAAVGGSTRGTVLRCRLGSG